MTIIPAKKIFSTHTDPYLSGDSISIEDTTKAMKEIYDLVQSQYYTT
jgi:hypothetical protein